MGVKGLQSFVERFPTVFRTVDVVQMVAEYRRTHPDVKSAPVIVVDGFNCIYFLVNQLEWVHGGQWDEYIKVFSNFLAAFKRIGVELVFFFDGLVSTGKREEWLTRRRQQIEKIKKVFEQIKACQPLDPSLSTFPAGLTNVIPCALKHLLHATVFCSMDAECDRTIASFAAHHKCLAILAQDSDYIIYSTVPYISMQYLDLKNMRTKMYCRDALCRELGIQRWMLPLFACLVGTDFISREILAEFHNRICANKFINGFPRIHTTVRCVSQFIVECHIFSEAGLLRRLPEIYGKVGVQNAISLKDFQKAVEEYTLDFSLDSEYLFNVSKQKNEKKSDLLYNVLLRKVKNSELIPLILNVICYGRETYDPSLEDVYAKNKIPSRVLVYRPMRQRMYELIFQLKDNYMDKSVLIPFTGKKLPTSNTVKEWWVNPWKCANNDQDIVLPLALELPDGLSNASILYDIIMENDEGLLAKKWAVFMACTGISISEATFHGISHKYKSLCVILNYLIKVPDVPIEMWEIEAFISQAVHPKFTDGEWQKKLQIMPYNSRAVHLAALFLRGADTLLDLMSLCGFPIELEHFMPWQFFNGRLFHYIYKRMHEGAKQIGLIVENKKMFQQLKDAIFEGFDDAELVAMQRV